MNLAVVSGLAPTKGIALPFVSAGGSGLVMTSLAAAVLMNIARQGTSSGMIHRSLADIDKSRKNLIYTYENHR